MAEIIDFNYEKLKRKERQTRANREAQRPKFDSPTQRLIQEAMFRHPAGKGRTDV